ncbi:MAG: flagellar hook-associated protein FlgK [Pseudomonadota bacterium]
MSISSAFNAALSGLSLANRSASVVSNNIANATTEGYGARIIRPSAVVVGGELSGVRVGSIDRQSDPVLLGQRRSADAEAGQAQVRASFATQLETLIGTPDQNDSLSAQIVRLENSLIEASNRPDSDASLGATVNSAKNLAQKLNSISDEIQMARQNADLEIGSAINFLNDSLLQLENINKQMLIQRGTGGDVNAYLDQQQVVVDGIADLIPIREFRTENGQLRLYSQDGISLLDGTASQFEFSATRVIAPDMTLSSGALSDITRDGDPLPRNGSVAGLSGGRLGALFELRDESAIEAQTQLDAIARDLAERFEQPGVDATRAATDPGFFTDNGLLTSPTDEVGLAQRLTVNNLVDPALGGNYFRLRDGLGALAPGNVGDPTVLQNLLNALTDSRPAASGAFVGQVFTLSQLNTEVVSQTGIGRQEALRQESFSMARQSSLRQAELDNGVNTDQELQKMLVIEKLFTANARVIEAASEMLDTLVRLGR